MKKIYSLILFTAIVTSFSSCDFQERKGFYIGKSTAYDDFLCCKFDWQKIRLPEQTLELEVGTDAFRRDLTLQVVFRQDKDRHYQPAGKVISVFRDGKEMKDGIIRISPQDESVKLKFRFNKKGVQEINSAMYKLSLKILNHGDLDILNGQPAKNNAIIDMDLLWDVKYEKVMNPLLKGIIWFSICFVTLVFLWFAILKRRIFPTFSMGTMQILYTEAGDKLGTSMLTLRKARMIVCGKNPKIQGWFKEFLCGRIIYEKNDFWEHTVEMKPVRAEGIAVMEQVDTAVMPLFRIPAFNITESNGPKKPYEIKRARTDKIARISIG